MIEEFPMSETVFERPTAFRAIKRYWYLILICAVLGAACGGVYAFKRSPVYTATARLSAISVNASNAASLAGSLQAAQELAGTFARVVQSSDVADQVAKSLHTTPAWAVAHVNGTPVPNSPFVMITATAPSGTVATQAANAALTGVNAYARKLVGASLGGSALLAKIRADSIALARAQTHFGQLKGQAARETSSSVAGTGTQTTPDPTLQHQIEQATAAVADAQTQLQGAQGAYTAQAQNQFGSRETVTASRAVSATNDRKKVAQIAILFGLLVGLTIGVASAMAIGSRTLRSA